MAEKRPDTIGSFLCLLTKEGRVRYQMRTEKKSLVAGISYKGDFELPGGEVQEKDLKKALTPGVLLEEAIRETKEELGIVVSRDVGKRVYPGFYRTVFVNPKDGKVDWAFATVAWPCYWDETTEVKRKIVDVSPDELDVLGRLNLIVSGRKRMWRMGQAGLYLGHRNDWADRAAELLTEVKSDWRQTELLLNPTRDLFQIRYDLGLEEDLYER